MPATSKKQPIPDWRIWTAILIILVTLVVLLLPSVGGGPASLQTQCKNNLKQIALALRNYHDTYHSFPPAYIADANGKPMHSWRVLILPFIEQSNIYEKYRFDEPWDGPNNRKLNVEIATFNCPADSSHSSDETHFVAVVGPNTMFPGANALSIGDCKDDPEKTVLLVEMTSSGISWLEPRDLSFDDASQGLNRKGGPSISSKHTGGAHAAFVPGNVQFIRDSTPQETLRRLLERNDGQPVGDF